MVVSLATPTGLGNLIIIQETLDKSNIDSAPTVVLAEDEEMCEQTDGESTTEIDVSNFLKL